MHLTQGPQKPDDFVVIGYMIIEGTTDTQQPRPELRGVVYTPTSCVCPLHPHADVLSWRQPAPELHEQYRQQLEMSLDDFIEFQEATERAFEAAEWGLDAVFVRRSTAAHFFKRFFIQRAQTRLMELSIRSLDLPAFLKATAPVVGSSAEQYEVRAMHLAAVRQEPAATDGQLLGFEVVGVNAHQDTHTSVCYAVREGFEQAGITFNSEGYLTCVDQAAKGARINNDEGRNPVGDASWFAVRLAELTRSQRS
ncbi:hypothetical protein [Deinococcus sp. QL22]|uniref:hypothetical protein n=1 Tax=Deinococcus sp. QL22 TaxID=2939437 RepID=UPI002017A1BA|nr:hypothetical protein [Deinococcus sp. QL22]UQN10557.1 hypothetical protein M1R55_30615 [Deinococcus sp. QL22]